MSQKLEENVEFFSLNGMEKLSYGLNQFLKIYRKQFPRKFDPVLLHNDYTPDNILFDEAKLSGIVDWDYIYAGDPARDVVKSATGFWMHQPKAELNIHEVFYDGYKEYRELGKEFTRIEPFYKVDTLARQIAGTIKHGEMKGDEIEMYQGEILRNIRNLRLRD